MDNGTLSCCAHSLRDKIGQPSGPDALDGLRVDNLRYTSCDVNSISASGSTTWGKYNEGMEDTSSPVEVPHNLYWHFSVLHGQEKAMWKSRPGHLLLFLHCFE